MSRLTPKLFSPIRWSDLSNADRANLLLLQKRLKLIPQQALTYAQLSAFEFAPAAPIPIRPSIMDLVTSRKQHAYSLGTERSVLALIRQENILEGNASVYQAARAIRRHLFGLDEAPRAHDVTIKHLSWLRIPPPRDDDSLHMSIMKFSSGNYLFEALNIYLALVIAHPFSDGNGRSARILFNVVLLTRFGSNIHLIPLSELLNSTAGIYEELLAVGHLSGNYVSLLSIMADAIKQYVDFVVTCTSRPLQGDLEYIHANATKDYHDRQFDLNTISPFPIAWESLQKEIISPIIDSIKKIIEVIQPYGNIIFAMAKLSTIRGLSKHTSISVFIDSNRKEALQAVFRTLREKMACIENVEFVIKMQDPILDAKILINISTFYFREMTEKDDALLLIYDFH